MKDFNQMIQALSISTSIRWDGPSVSFPQIFAVQVSHGQWWSGGIELPFTPYQLQFSWGFQALPETNSHFAPENRPGPKRKQKRESIPTIHF